MKYLVILLALLSGCGFPPPEGWTRFDEDPDNQAIIAYAEERVTSFMGVKPEYYEIWIADTLERTIEACYGGAACNKFGRIIIHPDTDEYICQQLVHEMWHSGTYALHQGWWVEPTPEFIAYISESCRKYGNW